MKNWAVEQSHVALPSTAFAESTPFANGERDEVRNTWKSRRRL